MPTPAGGNAGTQRRDAEVDDFCHGVRCNGSGDGADALERGETPFTA